MDLTRLVRGPRALPRWAIATLVANIGIVVTGGLVRLTGSGLGCPTWPRCTDDSFVAHPELGIYGAIEFGNRLLTFVLIVIAVLTFASAALYRDPTRSDRGGRRRDLFWLAGGLALGIPAQGVVGGITVLTDLNPWIVSLHLLCSLAIVGVAVLFLERVDRPARAAPTLGAVVGLAWATFASAWAVLYVGTVVTGSGPHAGDVKAPRNGLDPLQISQAHADAVFLFVGLSLGLVIALRVTGSPAAGVAALLVGVELAQGLIGFVQYFTDLPIVLVELHLLGAAAIATVMTWTLLEVREGRQRRSSITTGITRDVFSS
jgi:cytochrome c oxidase assembly protein subunit 15